MQLGALLPPTGQFYNKRFLLFKGLSFKMQPHFELDVKLLKLETVKMEGWPDRCIWMEGINRWMHRVWINGQKGWRTDRQMDALPHLDETWINFHTFPDFRNLGAKTAAKSTENLWKIFRKPEELMIKWFLEDYLKVKCKATRAGLKLVESPLRHEVSPVSPFLSPLHLLLFAPLRTWLIFRVICRLCFSF